MACRFFTPEPPGRLFKVYRTCINNCFNWTLFVSRQMGPVMWQVPSLQLPQMEMSTPICPAHVLTSSRGPDESTYLDGCDISWASHSSCVTNLEHQEDPAWLFMLPGLVMNSFPLSPWEHREESSKGEVFSSDDQTWIQAWFHQARYYNNTY